MVMPNCSSKWTDQIVSHAIRCLLNGSGGYLSDDLIAGHLGCSRRTVLRSVSRLETNTSSGLKITRSKGKRTLYECLS
jgi:biotin operon repressor